MLHRTKPIPKRQEKVAVIDWNLSGVPSGAASRAADPATAARATAAMEGIPKERCRDKNLLPSQLWARMRSERVCSQVSSRQPREEGLLVFR